MAKDMTFQEAAIESAKLYYDYLTDNGGGMITYRVSKITLDSSSYRKNEYWLQLEGKPKNIDSLQIKIDNNVYSDEQIKPLVYDSHRRMLKVSLNDSVKNVFEKYRPENVVVFSDLKFLVRRVEAWYRQFGNNIKLPVGKQTVKQADCRMLSKTPSQDQVWAIDGAITEPFTYVWGAPGTGKTQFVLARTVLAYLQAGKKILVTAPTNNAVDQTLYGILPVLEEAGLDYNKLVIRLGTANSDFLAKYPGVCEDSGYSKAISDILDRLSALRISLEESKRAERLHEKTVKFRHEYTMFMNGTKPLKSIIPRISLAGEDFMAARAAVEELLPNITKNEKELKECNNSKEFYNRQAQDLLKRLNNPVYALLSWFSKESEQQKVDAAIEKARYYEDKSDRIQAKLDGLKKEMRRRSANLKKSREAVEKVIREAVRYTVQYEELNFVAKRIEPETVLDSLAMLEKVYKEKLEHYISENKKYISVSGLTATHFKEEQCQIEQEIKLLEHKKKKLEQSDPSKRMEECLLVACTIDLCLNRLPVSKENHFAHVFLDEAGYSSLIKAATLTSYSERLTFLGDHMQLPPVCEADERDMKKEGGLLIALWAQSALFTESVFSDLPEKMCKDYLNKAPIPFRIMKKYNLLNSYRFGPVLAHVLADDVYDTNFRGNDGQDTKIYYVDAPKRAEQKKRTSFSECEAIGEIISNFSGLRESSGIIAPYRNQVELLRQMAKRNRISTDNVVTVHQSQGREWDNIFLSVTDTTDKFFTDSMNAVSDGKKVINTAVSRAKKNLIIVCDYKYWIAQKSQLIGKLLAVATRLDI